ncbi:MAG: phosphotransferase [Dehalococcoidia bacterium]
MKAGAATGLIAPEVVAAYPVAQLTILQELEGFRNENWLVEDERGHRYVLRRNVQHTSPERIEFQARFQQHLLSHGFPVARIIETRAGEPFAVDGDGFLWTLFEYVDGQEYDFARREQVVEAARRLAEFHVIAETFPGEGVALRYQQPIREWWATAAENQAQLEEMYAGQGVEDELGHLRERWRQLLAEWPLARVDALPVGWVHGDYHGRNVVFAGDGIRAVFDFDDMERGPIIYDVAIAAQRFGREGRGLVSIRPEVGRLFVREYSRVRTLTDEEREALPTMVSISFPPNAAYHRYCREHRGEDIVARLRLEVMIMRTLEAEVDRIWPTLRDA